MRPALPAAVTWLITAVVPPRARDHILRDLADDYAVRRRTRGASAWLVRETSSVMLAYAAARLQRLTAVGPICARDVTLVLRGFRRGPLAAAGAAAMLSTGLTAMMLTAGLSQTLLFRPVSATHGDALRRIAVNERGRATLRLSFPEWQIVREHLEGATAAGAVNLQPVVLRVDRESIHTMVEVVAGDYWPLAGQSMRAGRGLLSVDHAAGAPPTLVISAPFARRYFDDGDSALGQLVYLNGHPFTIAGVANALGSSAFLGASVDAWLSIVHADAVLNPGWRDNLDDRWFTAFALADGAGAELDGRLAAATATLRERHADRWRDRRLQSTEAFVIAGAERASVVGLMAILATLSTLILAAAAANLGGLLLARATAARRQTAVHLSIGAGRAAIVRRQLLEGALLGVCGAAMAIAMYAWAASLLTEIVLLPTLTLRLDMPVDSALIASVVIAGCAAGLLLASGPALWATRVDLADTLRDADLRASAGSGVSRLRRSLVAAQLSLTIVLIVAAVLFGNSVRAMLDADLGFDRENLIAFDFDVEPVALSTASEQLARELLVRVRATPGVVAAAMSTRAPVDSSTPAVEVRGSTDAMAVKDVSIYRATPQYFATVGVPLVAGREFLDSDADAAVVIVNESLASALWPQGDVIGRALYADDDPTPLGVIGVARNSKYRSITEFARPHVYRPLAPRLRQTLLVRTASDPRGLLRSLQSTFDTIGPGIVGFFPRTMTDHLAVQLLPSRTAAAAATVLGVVALTLSGLGLYGLVSWFVELRRREIGIRMALGASLRDVRWMVLGQTAATALPGMLVGLALATILQLSVRAFLFQPAPLDVAAIAIAMLLLLLVIGAAAYLPSRRATLVDPAVTLRS